MNSIWNAAGSLLWYQVSDYFSSNNHAFSSGRAIPFSRKLHLNFLQNENLTSINAQLRAQLRVASGNQAEELTSALEREREARDEAKQTKEAMLSLERELLARKQVIDAGNDTIILKVGVGRYLEST